ncbi:MAG: LexA family transcriptional regulator [Salegentibacter sp.]|uniref:Phage repressor protein C, contains Cro/C1-type HTH and peptisase s24 domains n=1 Tax=Salegentibacter flavus TaxID=287099 RepID=A0A1I4YYZ4_9FLAO|nr:MULTISPECIES: LexA family transcriptional regulator [Salegentibacter]MDR9458165.1 LexA family transcriptional regulator [Salegentibacter sp.]SFN43276.1 Phage repressor protein C, contains Cro/C1-type HTH and peptisase s24 domains [Salegentibacter flavus]
MGTPPSIEIKHFKEVREENNFTQSEFAELLGIKNSTADIERGRTKLSGKVVAGLLSRFGINPLWLFGESGQKYLQLSKGDVSPKVVTVDSADKENILMVNQKAAAGYPHNVQDVEWYHQLPAFDIPLPEFRNATYRGFQIEGDSMLPNYYPGEWVLGKAVADLDQASNNKVYVVVLYDSVLVKKLQKLPDSSKVLLISFNEEYLPVEVDVNDIQEIWQVNSKLTFNLDNPSQSGLFRELQESMEELKRDLKAFKKEA